MKVIEVNPEELEKKSVELKTIATDYESLYKKMMEIATNMGQTWVSADNLAFVEQIKGFMAELDAMTSKISDVSNAMKVQAENYTNRETSNVAAAKKLTN